MSRERSESRPNKRQRKIKQDPEFIFDDLILQNLTNERTGYEPGDIVWAKLGSFPWWPAVIALDNENGIYTRTFKRNKQLTRQYFVYFYSKSLEYAWLSARSLIAYQGLTNFIQNAESSVQQASTKSEKSQLANRYQLKVSVKKRLSWDQAIELADQALKLPKTKRFEELKNSFNQINRLERSQPKISSDEIEYEYKTEQSTISNIPLLSNFELKQIVERLLNHTETNLTFEQAQSLAINQANDIMYENYHYRLNEISSDWFYDSILLKHPSIIYKYSSWFDHVNSRHKPVDRNSIEFKQWQIVSLIKIHKK